MSKRRLYNLLFLLLGAISLLMVLALLIAILWKLCSMGYTMLHWSLLTQDTPGPSMQGGLRNAIIGSALQTLIALAICFPLGVLAATYLYLKGKKSRLTQALHFVNDLLLSTPSIVLGLFVYSTIVMWMGHFSGIAGSFALALIGFPIVVRAVEDILHLTPLPLKEAAYATGTSEWRLMISIIYHNAKVGMISAMLLAIARMLGETAPLLFTSLNNAFFTANPLQPMASLPVTIFQFSMSPDNTWQALAWSGALLITLFILIMSFVGRVLLMREKSCKH